MQFGGQHPGGMGVPAVGMAFPGYVAQSQLGGLGNSEMTWYCLLTVLQLIFWIVLSFLDISYTIYRNCCILFSSFSNSILFYC